MSEPVRASMALGDNAPGVIPFTLFASVTDEPSPRPLYDDNESVRAIRALQEQIASHVPVKETPTE